MPEAFLEQRYPKIQITQNKIVSTVDLYYLTLNSLETTYSDFVAVVYY